MIDKADKLTVTRQCALLDLNRTGIYYKPVPRSAKELELMRQIDEINWRSHFTGAGRSATNCGQMVMTWAVPKFAA